ncbi:hypothetical protein [Corallococcus exercitus]|uniref:Uncharacterized protein n=1 Tax=Corallococcus exercitus TaxID=2316736 RepID=A0A7Y4JYF8_9BACT|nr:hypothetical protein [Corallococcus exercitus]NOK13486.1 hypothetical protein [Corallococcus exercitus]
MHLVPCTSPCQARFEHMGRISGRTTVSGTATAQERGTWRVNGGLPLINQSISQNNAFDATALATTSSTTSSHNTVSTSGTVGVPSTSSFASAITTNGDAHALRGELSCPSIPPVGIGRVSDTGTPQDNAQRLSLRLSLLDFLYCHRVERVRARP